MKKIIPYRIYTDGSSKKIGNQLFGGWSFVVTYDEQVVYKDCGGEIGATNQQMEMTAIANALESIKKHIKPKDEVIIYSDSAYCINCYLQEWWKKWLVNGWVNAKKEPVKNQELWRRIIPHFENPHFLFTKVLGHSGNYFNEMCDDLAQREAEDLKKNWRGIE